MHFLATIWMQLPAADPVLGHPGPLGTMASGRRLVAMWMFGHVHCVLTFGVRILGDDGQTYVALRHQVHHEILQQISAMQAAPG